MDLVAARRHERHQRFEQFERFERAGGAIPA
jgi:hypothetical protein